MTDSPHVNMADLLRHDSLPNAPGVYRIFNTATGTAYIGAATRIRNRFNHHRGRLRAGKHHNARLQSEWHEYGASAFVFEVIEMVAAAELAEHETAYLLTGRGAPRLYNIVLTGKR